MKERKILIRPIVADDVNELADIWLRASKTAHAFIDDEKLNEQYQLIKDVYLVQAENWVIVSDDQLAGFIGLIDHHIGGLFIDPDYQGQGLGRDLLKHALSLKKHLQLNVYEDNQKAVNFYLKFGFVITKRSEKDDEGLPFAQLTMTLAT
ncbi:GNAT family N-acetyltransferase [Brucellaceae bacterium C25G]